MEAITVSMERAHQRQEAKRLVQSAQEPNRSRSRASNIGTDLEHLLTPKQAAQFLRLSLSWLAKARMRGDGPPYVKLGRAIRYREGAVLQWLRSRQRLSTSEQ